MVKGTLKFAKYLGGDDVDDKNIVELFWARSEDALKETQSKYAGYCSAIARNVLDSREDAEECVNDAYLRLWNAIPPERPSSLKAFLGRIVRNVALDRYDASKAAKRFNSSAELALHELEECLPSADASASDEYALKEAINGFLAQLPAKTRIVFMRRYWYLCSVKEIAESMRMTESSVKVTLLRTRRKLKEHLEKEEIGI